jgi:hypothetical protein
MTNEPLVYVSVSFVFCCDASKLLSKIVQSPETAFDGAVSSTLTVPDPSGAPNAPSEYVVAAVPDVHPFA